jgi:hypothetical protein
LGGFRFVMGIYGCGPGSGRGVYDPDMMLGPALLLAELGFLENIQVLGISMIT